MEDINGMKKQVDYQSLVKKDNLLLLASSFIIGLLFDILLYGKTPGISYPMFVIFFYCILFWNLKESISFKLDFGWFLSIPILCLSLTYFIFSNEIFMTLNFIAIPVLIIAQTILITGNNRFEWYEGRFAKDILHIGLSRIFKNLPKPFMLIAGIIHNKTGDGKYNFIKKIAAGLVISIPLLFVIVSLLSSADQVFGHFVGEIPGIFEEISFGEFISRLIIVIIFTIFSFSYIWSLAGKNEVSGPKAQYEKSGKKILDPVIIITILITINIVYILFVAVQFSYLFGSLKSSLPNGLTYAEYARRGFFELVVVTLINFSVLLGNINFVRKDGVASGRLIRILNSILVLCTTVMLFSAHFRMSLYEEKYGYTYLRVLTHAFMIFLLILFLIALYRIWNEGVSLLKPYIVTAIAAYLIINFVNIDTIIARNNIERFNKTNNIDVYYMSTLSYDAVREMIVLLDSKDKRVAREVENCLYERKEKLTENKPWQSFNWSKYRTKVVLDKYELDYESLKNYFETYRQ